MDVQQGVVERLGDPSPLLDRLARAAGTARAAGIRVIYATAGFRAFPRQAEVLTVDEWASGLPA